MTGADVDKKIAEVSRLLEERLGVRGRTFERQVRRAGRLLPRGVRRQARVLIDAGRLAHHPKLSRMMDAGMVAGAHERITGWLLQVDPRERRRARLLNVAATVAFNLLLFFAIGVTLLWWQGFV